MDKIQNVVSGNIPQMENNEEPEELVLSRTNSESTFTRHSKRVHAIIKEILIGIICMLQIYMIIKK